MSSLPSTSTTTHTKVALDLFRIVPDYHVHLGSMDAAVCRGVCKTWNSVLSSLVAKLDQLTITSMEHRLYRWQESVDTTDRGSSSTTLTLSKEGHGHADDDTDVDRRLEIHHLKDKSFLSREDGSGFESRLHWVGKVNELMLAGAYSQRIADSLAGHWLIRDVMSVLVSCTRCRSGSTLAGNSKEATERHVDGILLLVKLVSWKGLSLWKRRLLIRRFVDILFFGPEALKSCTLWSRHDNGDAPINMGVYLKVYEACMFMFLMDRTPPFDTRALLDLLSPPSSDAVDEYCKGDRFAGRLVKECQRTLFATFMHLHILHTLLILGPTTTRGESKGESESETTLTLDQLESLVVDAVVGGRLDFVHCVAVTTADPTLCPLPRPDDYVDKYGVTRVGVPPIAEGLTSQLFLKQLWRTCLRCPTMLHLCRRLFKYLLWELIDKRQYDIVRLWWTFDRPSCLEALEPFHQQPLIATLATDLAQYRRSQSRHKSLSRTLYSRIGIHFVLKSSVRIIRICQSFSASTEKKKRKKNPSL